MRYINEHYSLIDYLQSLVQEIDQRGGQNNRRNNRWLDLWSFSARWCIKPNVFEGNALITPACDPESDGHWWHNEESVDLRLGNSCEMKLNLDILPRASALAAGCGVLGSCQTLQLNYCRRLTAWRRCSKREARPRFFTTCTQSIDYVPYVGELRHSTKSSSSNRLHCIQ